MSLARMVFDYFFSSVTTTVANAADGANQFVSDKYRTASHYLAATPEQRAQTQAERYREATAPIKERHAARKAQMIAGESDESKSDREMLVILKEYLSNQAAELTNQVSVLTASRLSFFYGGEIKNKTLERDLLQSLLISRTYAEMILLAAQVVETLTKKQIQSSSIHVLKAITDVLTLENCRYLCKVSDPVIKSRNAL